MKPFYRAVDRTHETIGSIFPDGDDFRLEYDSINNRYIIVSDHPRDSPDEYQVGHTAGKIAGVAGLLPVIAVLFLLPIGDAAFSLLPETTLVGFGMVFFTLACALYAVASLVRFVEMSVWFQVRSGDDGR